MHRLVTSSRRKFEELASFGLPVEVGLGPDLPEVDGTIDDVIVRKALAAGDGYIVEDTVLVVGGKPLVDIRWRVEELGALASARVEWITSLGVNAGGRIRVHRGSVSGTIILPDPMPTGDDVFAFDPFIVPDGADGQHLHALKQAGRKTAFSARKRAVNAYLADDAVIDVDITDIAPWTGGWQGDHPAE